MLQLFIIKTFMQVIYISIIIMTIFDITTNVTFKLNLTKEILSQGEIFLFSIISISLGLLNIISTKLFSFEILKQ